MTDDCVTAKRATAKNQLVEGWKTSQLAAFNSLDGKKVVLAQPTEATLDGAVLPSTTCGACEVDARPSLGFHAGYTRIKSCLQTRSLGVIDHSIRTVDHEHERGSRKTWPRPEHYKGSKLVVRIRAERDAACKKKLLKNSSIGSFVRTLLNQHQLGLAVIAGLNFPRICDAKWTSSKLHDRKAQ